MSVKLIAKINLPYVLRMEKRGALETVLDPDIEFSFFKIIFFSHYQKNDDKPICNNIQIEAILNNYNHTDPLSSKLGYLTLNKDEDIDFNIEQFNVTDDDRKEIFKLVRDKLNNFLLYLNAATKMFWIEDIPLNPTSHVIGTTTDFMFSHPSKDGVFWTIISDNFMTDLDPHNIKSLNNKILDEYKDKHIVHSVWPTYLNKANKAMYLSEYEDFIIYCAIAAESFIKQLVNHSSTQGDAIFNKLKSVGKSQMVDTYFNIIMKYLYKTNLKEVKPELYKTIKDIFMLRNDIMHQGFLDNESYKKVGINKLDFEEVHKYFSRLELAIEECTRIATEELTESTKGKKNN